MINALRKFVLEDGVSSESANSHQSAVPSAGRRANKSCAFPAGVNPVGAELQRKFAGGVDYNMKIVIRGDRNTGKTAVWERLQGLPFTETVDTYTQTEEIQVASITWNYRARDFVVKLEVWDVVDRGRKEPESGGLKFGGKIGGRKGDKTAGGPSNVAVDVPKAVREAIGNTACDATTVNVYNGCDGVVFMFDVTRDWTWAYVRRELPSVPSHIPVLVMANKMDLVDAGQSAPSTIDECLQFLRVFNERSRLSATTTISASVSPSLPIPVRFAKASMKRAQGLKYLYNFFNLPFLLLQRNFLTNAIETNAIELRIAENELEILAKAEGQITAIWRQKGTESAVEEEEEDDEEEEEEDEEKGWVEEVGEEGGAKEEEKNITLRGKSTSPQEEERQRRKGRRKRSEGEFELSSSSSEGVNPHVSTYAEDIDEKEDIFR